MPKTATGQAPAPAQAARTPGRARLPGGRIAAAARRHWLMTALLVAGVVLRVLAQIGYRPALLYIDTLKYLYNAWPGTDPLGYKGVLKAILVAGNLQLVTAVQHLVGVAMGVAIYAVLVRRGVPRWLAALAAAPVLLDAYELQIEQTIMPDVWFEAVIVAGLALLLWRRVPSRWMLILAGIALGLSATLAQVGEFLVVPAVCYAAIVAPGWRWAKRGWRRATAGAAVMCAAFALPIVGYMSVSYVVSGHFWLSRSGTSTIYGRVAEAADCATLRVPSYERVLCPTAAQKALGPDGLDHAGSSPLTGYLPPPGMSQSSVVSSFTSAVITQQPLRVLTAIASDAARLFAVTRVTGPGDTPIYRWQFQDSYPKYQNYIRANGDGVIILGLKVQNPPPNYVYQPLDPAYGGKAVLVHGLAVFLRGYQLDGGYTPGPLYLAATVLGLLGTLSLARRGRSRRDLAAQAASDGRGNPGPAGPDLALACFLFFLTAVTVLLASDVPEFSWRYQLPAIVTLPPAGALGLAVIIGWLRARRGPAPAAPAHQAPEAAVGQDIPS